jgi:hypothetical protein
MRIESAPLAESFASEEAAGTVEARVASYPVR